MWRSIRDAYPSWFQTNQNIEEAQGYNRNEDNDYGIATPEMLARNRDDNLNLYNGQYWTRVISLDQFDPEQPKMIPVGPDLSNEQDTLFMIDASLCPELQILFDPSELRK